MTFSSVIFLALFMPVCLCGYLLADKKYRNLYLCLASVVFYAWNGISFLIVIVLSTTITYFVARLMEFAPNRYRKPILIVALIYHLGVLFYFKYFVVFAEWILSLANGFINVEAANIAPVSLPLGISFYTFSMLSYIVDVYWEKCKAQKNYMNVFLYILMFPKVVQGPIMRWSDFERQLYDRDVNYDKISQGIERFIKGLFKKVLIADQISPIVDYIFSDVNGIHSLSAWIGIIGYLLQLYYDFSGYTDMALGIGTMFGFDLPENFDHPYMSLSIPEFWRKWHASLGNWFRDYVYMPVYRMLIAKKNPITKKKYSPLLRDIIALLITWILVGQWHGAGVKFFIYGLWYYLFIVIDRFREDRRKKLKKKGKNISDKWYKDILYRIVTLFVIISAQTLFRANNVFDALKYIGKLFAFENIVDGRVICMITNSTIVAFFIGFIFIFPIYEMIKGRIKSILLKWNCCYIFCKIVWSVILLLCYVLIFTYIVASGYSPFLYQVF